VIGILRGRDPVLRALLDSLNSAARFDLLAVVVRRGIRTDPVRVVLGRRGS